MKFLRFLLFPFSLIYGSITTIRNLCYDQGWFTSYAFSIPVITVGNLSLGGTGKTPQIEYLIELLKEHYKEAVVSRGYKRKSKGFLLINEQHSVTQVGDEPMQYFNKFKDITVAVDENRAEGITLLIEKKKPEVILLDDAYQHRRVRSSFSILLTKFDDLFVDDFVLPVGNLRESRAGAKRSDIIIVTKCPENLSVESQKTLRQKFKRFHKPVFFTTISYANFVFGKHQIELDALLTQEVLLITGIANPNPLTSFLKEKGITFRHLKFPDHHHFSKTEVHKIQHTFDEIKSKQKIMLTTEKDYVRLKGQLDVFYLPIKTTFLADKAQFDDEILNHLTSK